MVENKQEAALHCYLLCTDLFYIHASIGTPTKQIMNIKRLFIAKQSTKNFLESI